MEEAHIGLLVASRLQHHHPQLLRAEILALNDTGMAPGTVCRQTVLRPFSVQIFIDFLDLELERLGRCGGKSGVGARLGWEEQRGLVAES